MSGYDQPIEAEIAGPRRKTSPAIIVLALVFAALVLGCAGLVGYLSVNALVSGGKEATGGVESLLAAMAEGRAAEYYGERTTAEFRSQSSAADFERLAEAVRTRLGGVQSLKQTNISVRQVNADGLMQAKHEVTFTQGQAQVETHWRRQATGIWRLQTLNFQSPQLLGPSVATSPCPHCGGDVAADAKFCSQCGGKISQAE